jgi:hypothetical protein
MSSITVLAGVPFLICVVSLAASALGELLRRRRQRSA